MSISAITDETVHAWFVGRQETPQGRQSSIGRLSSLFSFAIRRGWINRNPCRSIEPIAVDRRPPRILTPEEAGRVLAVASERFPRFVPYLVLGMFCGIRPMELLRLDWEAVRIAERVVIVDAAASKVRRRRMVTINETALAWLAPLAQPSGRILYISFVQRYRHALSRACGIDLTPDIMRHTAASYLMAILRDAGKVAEELGNSPGILLTHYRELVRREDAERFWALRPKNLQA
jgi:integrase